MGLNPTTLHHTTPPVTFRVLQDKLGSWNFAQTLIRPTRLKNRTHFYPNQPHLNLSLRGKLKTPKVFLSWTHLISVLLENFCQTPVQSKSVGLGVDFVLPLSQQEQPPPNISAVTDPILTNLKLRFLEHLEQVPTVTVTYVKATFIL